MESIFGLKKFLTNLINALFAAGNHQLTHIKKHFIHLFCTAYAQCNFFFRTKGGEIHILR